jgi:hypothetical protein
VREARRGDSAGLLRRYVSRSGSLLIKARWYWAIAGFDLMECFAFSTGRFRPVGPLARFDEVNAVGGVSLIEEPRTGGELNRRQVLPPDARLADLRRKRRKQFGGFPAPWTRPSAGAEVEDNITGEVPVRRLTQAILRKSVMRPMGSHSATRMSPLLRKIAP